MTNHTTSSLDPWPCDGWVEEIAPNVHWCHYCGSVCINDEWQSPTITYTDDEGI
jgi:hypothetical protein